MYASVTTVNIQPGKMNDFINLWNHDIKPFVQTFPGFVAAYVLTIPSTNEAMSIALYQTEAAATQSQTNGKFQEVVAMGAHLIVRESVVRKGYEVSLHP